MKLPFMREMTRLVFGSAAAAALFTVTLSGAERAGRWTEAQATDWGKKQGWLVGCNFGPSTAINQLEMWQADTFDPATIDRELGWAEGLGFNSRARLPARHRCGSRTPRVFCSAWTQFLELADKHRIGVMFVLLDVVLGPVPQGWASSATRSRTSTTPAGCKARARHPEGPRAARRAEALRAGRGRAASRNDRRVQVWDLFNEPDNRTALGYGKRGTARTRPSWHAAAEEGLCLGARGRSQPAADRPASGSATWAIPAKLTPHGASSCSTESDVITFHNYGNADEREAVRRESAAVTTAPSFAPNTWPAPRQHVRSASWRICKEHGVGAYNWGFVAGKTQTIYPWDSWKKTYTAEPPVWFHDIFRADGSAYTRRKWITSAA